MSESRYSTDGTLGAIGDTPLIEFDRLRPDGGARILAKWEGANPTGSTKDRMALAMVEEAERAGHLDPGQPLVECTGGSTGMSLAFVGAVKEYPVHIVTADCFADEKIRAMRALGAEVEVMETPCGETHPCLIDDLRGRMAEIREETGAYFTDQFNNPHQLRGYRELGEEILTACPEITNFVASVGTAGCAMGTARQLLERYDDVTVDLVELSESPVLTERRSGSHGIEGIATLDPPLLEEALYDGVVTVPQERGKHVARDLATEEGLLAGASSGVNVAAAIEVARELPPDDTVVTVAVDSGLKYLSGTLFSPGDDG